MDKIIVAEVVLSGTRNKDWLIKRLSVFYPDLSMQALEELADHIKQNKHRDFFVTHEEAWKFASSFSSIVTEITVITY